MSDELKKLAEQQEALLAEIATVKHLLEAAEWRRKCLWLFASINRTAENIRRRFPEKGFKDTLEPLDSYINFVFESAQDLSTVYNCLWLVARIFEDAERFEGAMSIWEQAYPLMLDLKTLDTGDPPGLDEAEIFLRDVSERTERGRDADRAAVRKRFEQRILESAEKRRIAEIERGY